MNIFLETNNLVVSVANKIICRNFNFIMEKGDIWGVLGPNGCGKTTLLHTLAGLNHPLAGEIKLLEKNLRDWSRKKMATKLGVLLQDTQFFFPQTVLEYCLAGRHPHLSYFAWNNNQDIAKEALRLLELDTLANQNIFTLSGGERRRLAIATLLTQSPELYFLDEPTNHLDLKHQFQVLNHFKYLAEKKSCAVMMALHDPHLAKLFCNKIMMIFPEGQIKIGGINEILNTENLAKLYQIDIRWKIT